MFLMLYLVRVQGLAGSVVGSAFLVVRLFDAVSDPIIGGVMTKVNLAFGKYKFWLLLGSLFSAIFFVMIFLNMPFSLGGKYAYYIIIYVLFGLASKFVDIAYWSLIPSTTSDEHHQGRMTSVAQILANIGTVLASVLTPIALGVDPTANIYLYVALVTVTLFLLTIFVPIMFMKEKPNSFAEQRITIKQIWTAFRKNDQARAFFFPILFLDIAFNLTLQLGYYYFLYDIGDSSKFSIFMIISGISLVLSILLYPYAAKKFGSRVLFITSCIVGIIGYNLMFASNMLFHGNVWILSSVGAFAMIGYGWLSVVKVLMSNKVCDYSEEKFGSRMEPIWVSMRTFSGKLASAMVALVAGVALDITSISVVDSPVELTGDALLALRLLIFVVPIIFVSLSLLAYMLMYKLDKKKIKTFPAKTAELPAETVKPEAEVAKANAPSKKIK